MYVCKECRKKREADYPETCIICHVAERYNAGFSRGPCEDCGKVADCVDCKCHYVNKPPRPAA